jgi:inner membrane protein
MPTVLSHVAVGVAAGIACAPKDAPGHFWALAILCSVLPDADVIGFSFGVPYNHVFGHRGFFHAPVFALIVSGCIMAVFFRESQPFSRQWVLYFAFFFLVSASHGILDAFTNGGLGIALLSPFDNTRFFFPWTPIMVSPINIKDFFSQWGMHVIRSELVWIWLPCCLLILISKMITALAVRNYGLGG